MNYQERVYDLILDEATRTQKALGGLAAVASLGLGGLAGLQPRATAKEIKPEERVEKKAPKRVGLPSVSKRAPVVTDKGKEEISKEKPTSMPLSTSTKEYLQARSQARRDRWKSQAGRWKNSTRGHGMR
tara:strand:+ start:1131 stop:1517 length:387 start_codon:yes stop_codon:yes gene_type:complete